MSVVAINSYFCKHAPLSPVFQMERLNFFVCSWLLFSELITRECEDLEAATAKLLMQLSHLRVVAISKASLGCYIHYQHKLLFGHKRAKLFYLETVDILCCDLPQRFVLRIYSI